MKQKRIIIMHPK